MKYRILAIIKTGSGHNLMRENGLETGPPDRSVLELQGNLPNTTTINEKKELENLD